MTGNEGKAFCDMLAPWHEFYSLLGTAAAALIALLFVAVSIATSVLTAGTG